MKKGKSDGTTRTTDTKLTFSQARRVLGIVEEKVKTREQLQKFQMSGLLTDLLSADPDKIDRNEFRKACGLPVSSWRVLLGSGMWDATEQALRNAGHYVETEYWPKVADRFETGKFNIVILDWYSDEYSAEHAAELKRFNPDCKVFMGVDRFGQSEGDPNSDGEIDVLDVINGLQRLMSK